VAARPRGALVPPDPQPTARDADMDDLIASLTDEAAAAEARD
jgi:hypothetical protein